MIAPARRRTRHRPCARVAEALPFRDGAFDAALAMLTCTTGTTSAPGSREMRRVARAPGPLLLRARVRRRDFWLVADYFPEILALETERAAPGTAERSRATLDVAARRAGAGAGRLRRRLRAAATGTGPRRTSIPSCRTGISSLRAARPRRPRAAAPNGCAPTSRRARGTRATATLRDARPRSTSATACSSAGQPTLTAVLRLVLPKGSLERATLQLFEDADLAVVRSSDVDYRADDRRPTRHRRHDPAPAGDPAVRRRRAVRPRRHRPRLDRGDRRRRRRRSRELHYSKATARPIRIVLAVAGDSPWQSVTDLPAGVRVHTEYPELTRRFLEKHGVDAEISLSYGATEAKIPEIADAVVEITETGRALRAAGLQRARHDPRLVHRAHRQPDRVRRPREAQGDGAAADAAHRRARSARPRAREAQRRRGEPRRR